MSVEQIKTAIEQLSFEERAELAAWFHGWKDDEWDEQMKRDVAEGKLDDVLREVEDDIAAGRLRDMPWNPERIGGSGTSSIGSRRTFNVSREISFDFGGGIHFTRRCSSSRSAGMLGPCGSEIIIARSRVGMASWLSGFGSVATKNTTNSSSNCANTSVNDALSAWLRLNGRRFGPGFCLGQIVDGVTEIAERLGILAVGDEQEIAGVAQCLSHARHGGVAGAIFALGLFPEISSTLPAGSNAIRESRIASGPRRSRRR
jgi:hypothetical protein